jgi:GTP cyclohydrolase I
MSVSNDVFEVVIVAGSNLDKERCLPESIRKLRRQPDITVRSVSTCYESAAVGGPADAPDFYNAAVLVTTTLDPETLRDQLHKIEEEMGRVRTDDPNAPRTADLDIIYYGDLVKEFDGWSIPDPSAESEEYIAGPVSEIAPDLVHPISGRTTTEISDSLHTDDTEVSPNMAIKLSSPYTTRAVPDFDDVQGVYAPRLESLVREQLVEIGEDPEREGLQRTPLRVAKAMDFLTSGYSTSVEEVLNDALFDAEGASEMVVVSDVEYYSMCEHHMLPFFGTATVAYLPKDKIIGLSKIARIVDVFARRLQVQERLTNQVADAMADVLDPHGVGVVMEGRHLCMMMRGVQKQESSTITSAMRGTFRTDARTRSEFLSLVS